MTCLTGRAGGQAKAWMDPATTSKFRLMRGAEEYKPVLRELIEASQLPVEYGGAPCARA